MSSASPEDRTAPSGGRKFIYASLLILLVAGIAIYFRLTPRLTAFASTAPSEKLEAVRAQAVSPAISMKPSGSSGTIGAEHFQLIQAPQLRGIRGAGTTLGNISTTTTPSSIPTFTPSTGSALDGVHAIASATVRANRRRPRRLTLRPPPRARFTTAWFPPRAFGSGRQ